MIFRVLTISSVVWIGLGLAGCSSSPNHGGGEPDNCPTVDNEDQLDTDGDGIGDACECLDVVCNAPGPCQTQGTCEPTTGQCVYPAVDDGQSCSDGDLCNGDETCQGGTCASGEAPTCEDDNPCTADRCEPLTGCQHFAADGPLAGVEPTTCGVGACAGNTGSLRCVSGEIEDSCDPMAGATTADAYCDGIDDDCDGEIDEDFISGEATCGVGACTRTGSFSCVDGRYNDSCEPGLPIAEDDATCDGIDDDCDGEVDEDTVDRATETCGVGACASNTGTISCVDGTEVTVACDPMAGAAPLDLVCNGIDEDCDGEVDEDYVPVTLHCGWGVCARQATSSCSEGVEYRECQAAHPSVDLDLTCDGLDEDCDGEVDEDVQSEEVICGLGECAGNAGERRCVRGEMVSSCDPFAGASADDSRCDGLDNDCDGEVDEDYDPRPLACGIGACRRTGDRTCVDGSVVEVCVPGEPRDAFDESYSDGIDNDCDGEVDEEYTPEAGCVLPDDAMCVDYNQARADAGSEFSFPNYIADIGLPSGTGLKDCSSAWKAVCPMAGCPDPDMAYCLDPDSPPSDPDAYVCWNIRTNFKCPLLMANTCPWPDTYAPCDDAAFYQQLAPGYDPSCASYVQGRCDELQPTACDLPSSLDECATVLADLDNVPFASCEAYLIAQCSYRIEIDCPVGSAQSCADIVSGQTVVHPLCDSIVADRCPDHFADLYCPVEILYSVDADSCMYNFGQLTREGVSDVCKMWVEERCGDEILETMEAHEAAGTVPPEGGDPVLPCDTDLVVEAGADYDYDVEDSISDATRFDCDPAEASSIPPHFQDLELTSVEEVMMALTRLSLNQRTLYNIDSCQEYATRKYWNYELFKTMANVLTEDPRRVFQLGYDDGPYSDYALGYMGANFIAPFRAKEGTISGYQPMLGADRSDGLSPKNDYLQIFATRNTAFLAHLRDRDQDPDWIDSLEPLEAFWYRTDQGQPNEGQPNGWQWHDAMSYSTAMLHITDEELFTQYARRKAFELLLAEYREALTSWEALPAQVQTNPARLAAHNDQLNALVDEADDLIRAADAVGCFEVVPDSNGGYIPSVCDWAPQDFERDVDDAFMLYEAQAERKCRETTPADLSAVQTDGYDYLVELGNSDIVEVHYSSDPTLTIEDFERYMERLKDTERLASTFFRQLDDTERPVWGESYGDSAQWGDPELFAAGYDYGASWEFIPPDAAQNLCSLSASAEAHLQVTLNILDPDPLYVVDGGITVDSRTLPGQAGPMYETHLIILNDPKWQMGATMPGEELPDLNYAYNVVYDAADFSETQEDSYGAPVFSLAGFNINLSAGYSAKVGMEMNGSMQVAANVAPDGACTAGMDLAIGAQLVPYAKISGMVECGIDLYLAELGIGGELTLLEARLPINLNIGATAAATVHAMDADIFADVSAKLVISTLSGRLYVYIDPVVGKKRKKTWFEWDGLAPMTVPIMNKHFSFDLGEVFQYCDESGGC